jgi:hypothetical protein
METTAGMRIVGRLKGTSWKRFVKLQRMTSELGAGSFSQPRTAKGFKSFEECEEWTWQHRTFRAARPPTATSSPSPAN